MNKYPQPGASYERRMPRFVRDSIEAEGGPSNLQDAGRIVDRSLQAQDEYQSRAREADQWEREAMEKLREFGGGRQIGAGEPGDQQEQDQE